MSAFPRSLSSIAVSVGGLALFLICASVLLISYPLGSTVQLYFYGDDSGKTVRWDNETVIDTHLVDGVEVVNRNLPASPGSDVPINSSGQIIDSGTEGMVNKPAHVSSLSYNVTQEEDTSGCVSPNITDNVEIASPLSMDAENNSDVTDIRSDPICPDSSSLPKDVGMPVDSARASSSSSNVKQDKDISSYVSSNITDNVEIGSPLSMGLENNYDIKDTRSDPISPASSSLPKDVGTSVDSGMVNKSAHVSSSSSNVTPEGDIRSYVSFTFTDIVEIASPFSVELEDNSDVTDTRSDPISPVSSLPKDVGMSVDSGTEGMVNKPAHVSSSSSNVTQEEDIRSYVSSNITDNVEIASPFSMGLENNSNVTDTRSDPISPASSLPKDVGMSVDSGCDLYRGSWFYDPSGPLYTNNTCPVLTQAQNCQGNGRPDKEYENWRWKPSGCDLPKFDGRKFLELMRGKKLAFIGDSVARNQMESLLCLLWQAEVPYIRGSKKIHRWIFKSASVVIARVWSSWLVHRTSEPLDIAPEGVDKIHLDIPDEGFMDLLPKLDVVVISSGHWFVKQSVYVLKNEIVGGQLWWPDKSRPMKINSTEAFGIATETILTAIVTHPNYTGLTIVRSYSPDHYEGGAWNTGGSCTGKVKPLSLGELVENSNTNRMHEKQVTGFNNAIKKATNKSKMKLMDITEAFAYRHDGHPGPYRNTDPNKITQRGPDGKPPPQDCLHWCMPGPVDTWNELVLEIIRREFECKQKCPS